MTVEACTQLAWSRGYAIAALQYSNECYAGKLIRAAGRNSRTRWWDLSVCSRACMCRCLALRALQLPSSAAGRHERPHHMIAFACWGPSCVSCSPRLVCTTQQPCCCCCCRSLHVSSTATATSETSATRFGPATNCDSPCVNASTDPPGSCGGGLANSLYRLRPQPEGGVSPPPPPPAGGGGAPAPPPGVIPVPTTTLNVTALGKLI
jgi:hypothetical protein